MDNKESRIEWKTQATVQDWRSKAVALSDSVSGYVAPVERKTLLGQRFIEVHDLNHPEAIDDFIHLLKSFGRGRRVEVRITR